MNATGRTPAGDLTEARRQLLALRLRQKREAAVAGARIPSDPEATEAPASHAQEALWFIDAMFGPSGLYNSAQALRLRGPLDVPALQRSLQALVARHASLRTAFESRDGSLVQVLKPECDVRIEVADIADAAAVDGHPLEALLRSAAVEPFDLAKAPLIRARLYRHGPTEHILLLVVHHIVFDGWSMSVVARDLGALYDAIVQGAAPSLVPLPLQFLDYARWERESLRGERLAGLLRYWRDRLEGLTPLAMPTDRPRRPDMGNRGAVHRFVVPPRLLASLRQLAQAEGATLFMVLLAAFQVLLKRHAGQDDVVVGSPVAGRTRPELENLVGYFVNSVVLRTDLSGAPSFSTLLARVREIALQAYAEADLPFDRLVAELQPVRDLSSNPLYQVSFALNNQPPPAFALRGLKVEPLPLQTETAKFDLALAFAEREGRLEGALEYNTELFDAPTVHRLAAHLQTLLEAIAADPSAPIDRLPLLSPADREAALGAASGPVQARPADECLHHLFEAAARARPEAVAARAEGLDVTYGELERRSAALASRLGQAGIGPDDRVGICLPRGIDMLVSVMAVLRAGAAYVPLDPHYPDERLTFMVSDASARVVLCHGGESARFASAAVVVMDPAAGDGGGAPVARTFPTVRPEHLAYVIYTSGSTGVPKGVALTHRGICNHVRWMVDALGIGPGDVFLQKTSISFDASLVEIFVPLSVGATTVLVDGDGERDTQLLARAVRDHRVTVLQAVPSALAALLQEPELLECRSLRRLISGGEALDRELARAVRARLPWVALGNFYGPTEATIDATWHEVVDVAPGAGTVPIGRAVANARCHVLDEHREPVPVGVPGELYIGGVGLARGYLGRPELDAERFVADPFVAGERLYRSGDLARRLADGSIEYLGRVDDQVKLRGFRIELGEIEAAIQELTTGRPCAVLLREDRRGSPELVAYIEGGADEASALREQLRGRLPEHMRPSIVCGLTTLPRLRSGKIDRKALPAPVAERAGAVPPLAPRTPTEAMLLEVWREVLGVDRVGVLDNFFELGGHSLLAAQVAARARRALSRELPLRWLFEQPTVAGLAALLERSAAAGDHDPDAGPQPGDRPAGTSNLPASFAQRRMWLLQQLDPHGAAYHMAVAERLCGSLDVVALQSAWQDVCDAHEAFRTTLVMGEDEPVQRIGERQPSSIEVLDHSTIGAEERDRRTREALVSFGRAPFDLSRGPLHRALLVREASDRHVLMLVMHHAIGDDWSLGLVQRDLAAAYRARCEGVPASVLAPPRLGYADFAAWERRRFSGDRLQSLWSAWRERLGDLQPLALPTDRRPPSPRTGRGGRIRRTLSVATVAAVRAAAAAQSSTPFMVLLAAFSLLLARRCGQDDVVVGTPVTNRPTVDCEQLVGVMLNTLVLRLPCGGDRSFGSHVERVRATVVDAFAHRDMPYELLVERLRAERGPASFPDLRVMFNVLGTPHAAPTFESLVAEPLPLDLGTSQVDLSMQIDLDRSREVVLVYASDVFDEVTAERWADAFLELLGAAVSRLDVPVSALPACHRHERATLEAWNDTSVPLPPAGTVHALVDRQAARSPDAPALQHEGEPLTHGDLQRRSNRLARELRARGARRGVLVGLCLERSADMVVALLAILKSGAGYVPLDPDYPPPRLRDMAADAQLALLVTQSTLAPVLDWPRGRSLWLDGDAEAVQARCADPLEPDADADAGPDDPAYVIYTSGSTGKPKGVVVLHGGVVNFLASMAREPGLEPADRLVAVTTLSFDIAVLELLLPLTTGAQLVLASRMTALDGRALRALVERSGATVMQATPSTWRLLIEAGWRGSSRFKALIGGEPLPPDLARALGERTGELWNMYGPTETTVWSTCLKVPADAADISIGRPIANTQVHVLDAQRRPVPIGVTGEICIGGMGVAGGYLHREELTQDRFIEHPLAGGPGRRLYRTGDLGRWRSDGTLEHLGRMDFQVKVRGHRIELGEIESQLLTHPAVSRCVATTREDRPGDVRVVAYVVASGSAPAPAELRSHLAARLPAYMIPQHFVLLEELPLLPNGKVDRKGLPVPEQSETAALDGSPLVDPSGDLERALAGVWCKLLKLERISVIDSFFDLGGHSLLAARLVRAIEAEIGRPCNLQMLYRAPTVRALAELIARGEMPSGAELVRLDAGHAEAKLFFVCGVHLYQPLARQLADLVSSYGVFLPYEGALVDGEGARGVRWPTVPQMAADYVKVIRAAQPSGPYRLAGVSFGGVLAFEIAQQLRLAGEHVESVALLDSMLRGSIRRSWWRWAWGRLRSGPLAVNRTWSGLRGRWLRYRRLASAASAAPLAAIDRGAADAEAHIGSVREAIYLRAIRRYQPRPYRGAVLLARAMHLDLGEGESTHPTYHWDRYVTGLEVVELPGDHVSMLFPPNVSDLAERLRSFLGARLGR